MKRIIFIALAAIIAIGFNSCKTSEKNYKAAYDIAVHKKNAMDGVDSTTYGKILKEQTEATAVVAGDSVRLVYEHFNIVDDKPIVMKEYGVVVGEYKQIFNARSFRERLKKEGKPSYVVIDAKRNYFVIVRGFDTSTEAATYLKNIHKDVKMRIPIEKPWILGRPI